MTHTETLFALVNFMRSRDHIKRFNLTWEDAKDDGEWSVYLVTNTEPTIVEYGITLENVSIRTIISLEEYLMKNAESDYVVWKGVKEYEEEDDAEDD